MFTLIVLLYSVALVTGQTTQVSECINHAGDLPLNTYIEGCIEPPCRLPQLQDVVINIIFEPPRILRSMRTLATAYLRVGIITVPVPYPLGDDAITCNFLTNTYCPVLPGEVVQYTLRFFIESIFQVGVSVDIEFRVVDDNNDPVLCLRTSLTIVDPLQRIADHSVRAEDHDLRK